VPEQPLAGPVHQSQHAVRSEREHRDVDLLEDLPQRLGGLDRPEPLVSQDAFQRVHFLVGE
jgi:hypothetical protein